MAQSGGGSSRRGAQAPLPGAHPHPPPPHTHDPVSLPYHWHDKQELIQRELEEARARATQMEKTMRWWSDCTANWREKWSKVKSQRSRGVTGVLRREKNDLEAQMALISQTHMMRSRNKDDLVEKPTDLRDQVDTEDINNHKGDSPERDGSTPARPITQTEAEKLSSDELQFIRDAKNTNFSLLEEMFGSRGSHHEESLNVEPGEATRLSEKCRMVEVKDLICDEYLKDSAVKEMPENCHHPQRENDVEEKLIHSQQQEQAARDSTNINYVRPPSDTCHINPRISAVSDPMSEVCGGSECSEGGYEEPIRPSDTCANANPGVNRRGWRTNNGGSVMESSAGGSVIDDTGITPEQETLEQQVKMMKLRLEEATKTIQAERDEKLILHREVSKWQSEANELRARLEDIRASRQEAVKELVSLRTQHQKEVQCLQLEMLDEASSRECVDRRLADLRAELERLQEENAKEWGRRERLESEKIGMERDNKKLRAQVSDLEERLDKRSKLTASTPDSDVAQLKQEIADKYKELSELKHAHAKLKKVLADKSVELQHTTRRADQYESEVKRLRGRVEELKKELAASEDEVDGATNNIRKLQRGNDELQETVENLELQVEHLQSRLRSSQAASLPLRTANLLQDSDDDHAQF
ncbi:coiled-coil domain-containing protein 102A-like [Penaeus japonicus]|uniref:coiled-coil domain-containing protein 102A-like n=1 Tax=Penaeus japonicus TaxID=27405 RepID=UPI001C716032|nr:coiled-coil domain-containing protein 102A-like [Penaeus japonicus]